MSDEWLMTARAASKLLCISEARLKNDRWQANQSGTPPKYPFVKLPSGAIRYRKGDLIEVIEKSTVR